MSSPLTCCLLIAIALLCSAVARAAELEPLPPVAFSEPTFPLAERFTDEPGFWRRWQLDHQRRVKEGTTIETDRPTFTLAPTVVPQGWVQLETGFTGGSREDSTLDVNQFDIPQLNLRIGVLPRLEARVMWGGASKADVLYKPWNYSYTSKATSDMAVGLKYQVSQQRAWIPQSAFVADLVVPTGDYWRTPYRTVALGNNSVSGIFDYIYCWQVSERIAVGGSSGFSVGSGLDGSGMSLDSYFQSAIFKFFWTPRLTLFTEFYSISTSVDSPDVVDFGLKWLAYNNVQYDFIAGFPLVRDGSGCYISAGVSYRY
jgi:hypothetical protein